MLPGLHEGFSLDLYCLQKMHSRAATGEVVVDDVGLPAAHPAHVRGAAAAGVDDEGDVVLLVGALLPADAGAGHHVPAEGELGDVVLVLLAWFKSNT